MLVKRAWKQVCMLVGGVRNFNSCTKLCISTKGLDSKVRGSLSSLLRQGQALLQSLQFSFCTLSKSTVAVADHVC